MKLYKLAFLPANLEKDLFFQSLILEAFSDNGENFFDYNIFSWPKFCTSIFAESKIWWWSSAQASRHRSRLSGTKISVALDFHTIGRNPS